MSDYTKREKTYFFVYGCLLNFYIVYFLWDTTWINPILLYLKICFPLSCMIIHDFWVEEKELTAENKYQNLVLLSALPSMLIGYIATISSPVWIAHIVSQKYGINFLLVLLILFAIVYGAIELIIKKSK